MASLFADLTGRGIVKQVTDPGLEAALASPLTLYAGFDPTSDSLHVGSLLPLMTLKRFQDHGHRVIAVVGGATGMVGDPSGKSQERQLLDEATLARNLEGIRKAMGQVLKLDGPNPAVVVNNADWFKGYAYLDFLRDVGKHFTINHMMAKESVRARLEDREHGISYTEFSYMLLQAYDFYVLHKQKGCRLQIGGSDQWGNITAGIELIRRMQEGGPQVFGLTHPLVMKADGSKFGKSESGAVWLDANKTSAYQFYQYFLGVSDADVIQFLKFFSPLPLSEILDLQKSVQTAPEKREAQQKLAQSVTELVHGKAALEAALGATQALFSGDASLKGLSEEALLQSMGAAPTSQKEAALLSPGWALVDAVVETGLCPSKGQARKDIAAGGIYVNQERLTDPALLLTRSHLLAGDHIVLRKGKKTYHLLRFTS